MTDPEKAIRRRARDDADSLENERPTFAAALEVAQDLCEAGDADDTGPAGFLAAVAVLGAERAAAIYNDEWDAIEHEAAGGETEGGAL